MILIPILISKSAHLSRTKQKAKSPTITDSSQFATEKLFSLSAFSVSEKKPHIPVDRQAVVEALGSAADFTLCVPRVRLLLGPRDPELQPCPQGTSAHQGVCYDGARWVPPSAEGHGRCPKECDK